MNKDFTSRALLKGFLLLMLLSIGGCDSDSDDEDNEDETVDVLPDGLALAFLNASDATYIAYDTTSERSADINEVAAASSDSAVQKMVVDDTADIGFFFHWPDFRVIDDEEYTDMKYLLMKPGYSYQSGAEIDSEQFVQLVHLHDEDLAAHSADEFDSPEAGSNQEAGLMRLNEAVAAQEELENELAEVLPGDQTLCRAYVDPYLLFEHEHEEEHEEEEHEAEEEHEHGDLMHYALTQSGRIYFYQEGEAEELESSQGFVALDNVTSINDCSRTTIARVSEEGILVFVPDSQSLYLVDSHEGADFHQHSVWALTDILPEGSRADLMAVVGSGSEHEHDYEEDDHEHEEGDHEHEGE